MVNISKGVQKVRAGVESEDVKVVASLKEYHGVPETVTTAGATTVTPLKWVFGLLIAIVISLQ